MQNVLKSNEWPSLWIRKPFKFEIEKIGPNKSDFLQNWFFQEIRSPSLICRKFKSLREILLNRAECIEM